MDRSDPKAVPMLFDLERVRKNAREATLEDLLDRVTVFRNGMEAEALDVVERELRTRGIGIDAIEAHARGRWERVIFQDDGTARPCSFCHRPAVRESWDWYYLLWLVPLFRRRYSYCDQHLPLDEDEGEESAGEDGADLAQLE